MSPGAFVYISLLISSFSFNVFVISLYASYSNSLFTNSSLGSISSSSVSSSSLFGRSIFDFIYISSEAMTKYSLVTSKFISSILSRYAKYWLVISSISIFNISILLSFTKWRSKSSGPLNSSIVKSIFIQIILTITIIT